jgi:hypothetical protein
MGIETFLKNARKRAVRLEINKLINACEQGKDMSDALIVDPLSDLDVREKDGWIRPDGLYYEDYVLNLDKNEINFLIEDEDGTIASFDSTIDKEIETDNAHRDWQSPSGTLYEG